MLVKFSNHRNEIERQIIVLLVEDMLAAGYAVGVNDGAETVLAPQRDEATLFAAMSSTGEDYLVFRRDPSGTGHDGWVRLIYGNGCDVVSDYTTNLPESVMVRSTELADRFS